jgi:hypothetical protein
MTQRHVIFAALILNGQQIDSERKTKKIEQKKTHADSILVVSTPHRSNSKQRLFM